MFFWPFYYSAEGERSQGLGFKSVLLQRARWTIFRITALLKAVKRHSKPKTPPVGSKK
jgi:hypothetical protein